MPPEAGRRGERFPFAETAGQRVLSRGRTAESRTVRYESPLEEVHIEALEPDLSGAACYSPTPILRNHFWV